MELGMTPEFMYGQNVFVPAAANPYPYGYAGNEISYLGVVSVVGVALLSIPFGCDQFVKCRSCIAYGMV